MFQVLGSAIEIPIEAQVMLDGWLEELVEAGCGPDHIKKVLEQAYRMGVVHAESRMEKAGDKELIALLDDYDAERAKQWAALRDVIKRRKK